MPDSKLVITAVAFLGALGAGFIGWCKSGQPFKWREYAGTMWAAVITAALFGLGFEGEANAQNILYAFLAGAGVDLLNRRIGEIRSESKLRQLEAEIARIAKERTDGDT